MHFDYYAPLSECSFSPQSNSSVWKPIPLYCSMPTNVHETYSGSYDFSLNFRMMPINEKNQNISFPFNFTFTISSNIFNVTSQIYSLQVNSIGYQAISVAKASLTNKTLQNGSYYYAINATFYIMSDHTINVTYGCPTPFNLLLTSPSNWKLDQFYCNSVVTYTIPAGRFKYTLTANLVNSDSKIYDYTTPLPSEISLQITLGNNLIVSNVYDLET